MQGVGGEVDQILAPGALDWFPGVAFVLGVEPVDLLVDHAVAGQAQHTGSDLGAAAAVVVGCGREQHAEDPAGGQPLTGNVGGPLEPQSARPQPLPCGLPGLIDLRSEFTDVSEHGPQRIAYEHALQRASANLLGDSR